MVGIHPSIHPSISCSFKTFAFQSTSAIFKMNANAISVYMVHGALILASAIFGLGSVVGALGLKGTNPLIFSFAREIISGILLFVLSATVVAAGQTTSATEPHNNTINLLLPQTRIHFFFFCRLGVLLFATQFGYIVGIQLAGPTTASIWQPTTPILTAAISMILELEQVSVGRLIGVFISFLGCVSMVLLGPKSSSTDDWSPHSSTTEYLIGNLLLFLQCTCSATFIIVSKDILSIYPPLTVTAWSNLLGAPWMLLTAYLLSAFALTDWICPECSKDCNSLFYLPQEVIPALVYYILFMSVGAWGLLVWANQHATGTLVLGYAVLHPITSILLTSILLLFGFVPSCFDEQLWNEDGCLNPPGLGTLCGILGVIFGLSLVIATEPSSSRSRDGMEVMDQGVKGTEMEPLYSRHQGNYQ